MSDDRPEQEHATVEQRGPPRLADPAETERDVTAFVRRVVDDAGADGVVVNLSGGLDSTVTATLAAEALGSDRVYGLVLPADANRERNVYDALHVAENLVIDYRRVDVQPLVDRLVRTLTTETRETDPDPMRESTRVTTAPIKPRENYQLAIGNAAARLRMAIAYFEANTTSRLVLGTSNRTELLLGYFTKYGDGAADLFPLGDLYKTEVRELARHLDVREAIVEKEPTAGMWAGQTDQADLGADYGTIDAVLHHVLDLGRDVEATADATGVAPDLAETYLSMCRATEHKRRRPPTPSSYRGDESGI